MNATQEAKLNMYRATQQHCEDNAAIVATVPAFSTAFNSFKSKVAAIIATVQQEDLVTKGVTIDKSEAKKTLCQLAADIAAPIFAFASSTNDNKLKQEVNFSYSDLFKSKDDQLAPRCQNIHDAGTSNLAALAPYGITAATLTTFQTTIDNYQTKVPTPRNAAALKVTIRTNLRNLIKETDKVLKEQMDKTAVGFKTSNPDFVRTYKANRVIIDPTKTTTTLKGAITNSVDKKFIAGATVVIEGTKLNAITNESGEYEIKPAPVGTFNIIATATKFKDQTKTNVAIKQGQINKQDFPLDPA